jgi:site-specific DNA recombinase
MLITLAQTVHQRIRPDGSRNHLCALAQRVDVDTGEVRMMGSKGDLLRTLAGAAAPTGQVPSFVH